MPDTSTSSEYIARDSRRLALETHLTISLQNIKAAARGHPAGGDLHTGLKWKPSHGIYYNLLSQERALECSIVSIVLTRLHPTVLELPPRSYREQSRLKTSSAEPKASSNDDGKHHWGGPLLLLSLLSPASKQPVTNFPTHFSITRPLQAQAKAEPGTTPGPTSVWITTSTHDFGKTMASYHEIHQPTRLWKRDGGKSIASCILRF